MTTLLIHMFGATLGTFVADLGIDFVDRRRFKAAEHVELEPMNRLLARTLFKTVLAGVIYGGLLLVLGHVL